MSLNLQDKREVLSHLPPPTCHLPPHVYLLSKTSSLPRPYRSCARCQRPRPQHPPQAVAHASVTRRAEARDERRREGRRGAEQSWTGDGWCRWVGDFSSVCVEELNGSFCPRSSPSHRVTKSPSSSVLHLLARYTSAHITHHTFYSIALYCIPFRSIPFHSPP